MQTLTVGILADPGLPEKVAHRVAEDLPRALAEHVGDEVSWAVEVSRETLPLTADGNIPLLAMAGRLREEYGWDCVVYLTDLPRVQDGDPLLWEVGADDAAVLICLPGLGADHFSHKVRRLLVALIGAIRDGAEDGPSPAAVHAALGRAAARLLPSEEAGGASSVVLPGRINRLRLLIGMVLSNRPGRLLSALSSCVAAAAATGAFGIFYASIWNMSDALSPVRLAVISVVVTAALAGWLILRNGLWNRSSDEDAPWRSRWDNASTLITVWLSVAMMYVLLWAMLLLVGLAVIETGYLEAQLGHPVTLLDYLSLSWLAASLGTLAGALGSNFDSDEAIREATYSRREHQRRQLADTYDD